MKKLFISFLAVAAIAACSKSEVAYEASAEIGFAPVKGNVTKASGLSGTLAKTQELGVWAYWDNDGAAGTTVSNTNAANFSDTYLDNALFVNVNETNKSWGAPTGKSYPWPVNGSLIFAGYTTPGDNVLTTGTAAGNVKYDRDSDVMTFTGYENTNEFDLCWFARTAKSYNNRVGGEAIEVGLKHALTWVSVAVCAEGSAIGWKVTSMKLNNTASKGTATCSGSTGKATWGALTTAEKSIYTGEHTLTAGTTSDNKTTGDELTNNILIPSDNVTLTVNYDFLVNGQTKSDSKTVTLNTTAWESGKHYTYTLVFKSNEILVSPSYDTWGTSDQTVTVE